jgi:uncharacterized protein YjbI with pentapeptide repeats
MNNQELSSAEAQLPHKLLLWRTEPEIDVERQEFLAGCLATIPDIKQGIYPFKDIKLSRADVEWLLLKHEEGHDLVNRDDEQQWNRSGLDLRGADLRRVNLSNLPLTRMRGGLTRSEWNLTTLEQRQMAGVHLEGADLSGTHLEKATLEGAYLEEATLRGTHLEEANLFRAYLKDAYLREAHLEKSKLRGARLEGTYLREAYLNGADLREVFFDSVTNLEGIVLNGEKSSYTLLADAHWSDVNLSVVNWTRIKILGDEYRACQREANIGTRTAQEKSEQLEDYHEAVRANRQLASAMRAQGMNEEAIPFSYRAQKLQKKVLWRQLLWGQVEASRSEVPQRGLLQKARELRWRALKFAAYIFYWFLDILAGYGYKPGRSLFIYFFMITVFAICYFVLGHLSPKEAVIFSVTSFHGRGFLPGPFSLNSPVTALAAVEAVVGLFIEISFIATFTQRCFGR